MVGEPADIQVRELVWFPENVEHIARHGVRPEDVEFVLANGPRFFRNLPGRSATHVMLGRDPRGRALHVPLARAGRAGRWFAVTAWESRMVRRLLASLEAEER